MRRNREYLSIKIFSLLTVVMLLVSGCNMQSIQKTKSMRVVPKVDTYSTDFNGFANEVFSIFVSGSEIDLHSFLLDPEAYGIDTAASSWGDMSPEQMEEGFESLILLINHLETFDYENLNNGQKITYDMLMTYLEGDLAVKDLYLLSEPLGPMSGEHRFLAFSLDTYQIDNEEDLEMYLTLVKDIEIYVESICLFEKAKSEAGFFMKDEYAEMVIDDCEEMIDSGAEDFFTGFAETLEGIDWLTDEEKEEYKDRNRKYIEDYVIPAYQNIVDSMTDLLGTGEDGIGLARYEGGKDYYTQKARATTGTDMTVDEMFALLEQNAGKWLVEYEASLEDIDYTLLYSAFSDYETPESVIENNLIQMEGLFPEIPDRPDDFYLQKEMPASVADFASGMFLMPQLDEPWENKFYLNDTITDAMTLYEVTSHECVPGHLYQTVYFLLSDSENIPLRYYLSAVGIGLGTEEGWTTYIEFVSNRMAGLPDAENLFVEKYYNVYYAAMSLLDIGVNYYGWDREEAEEYFEEIGLDILVNVSDELIEDVDTMPTMYLSYTVGFIELTDMMARAEKTLGSQYSQYEFHKFYLDVGPCTFDIMNREMDTWLEEYE